MPAPNAITPTQLNRLIGTPDCPEIVDISIDPEFAENPFLIPGSWLIRRFVDPRAHFLFVSPGEAVGVADRYGAQLFDIEDVFWSHRGENCTFGIMLEEFQLISAPLTRLADVIRGADTNRDDHAQPEAGMTLYDALYRWARDGQTEGHDWPAERM